MALAFNPQDVDFDVVRERFLMEERRTIVNLFAQTSPDISIIQSGASGYEHLTAREALNEAKRLEAAGDLPGAAGAYRTVAELIRTPEVYLVLGTAYFKASEYGRSVAAMRRSIALSEKARKSGKPFDPQIPPTALFGSGLANVKLGKTVAALKDVLKSLSLAPENPGAHLLLAHIRTERGHWEAAVREFEEVQRLAPDLKDGYLYLADLYARRLDLASNDAERKEALDRAVAAYRTYICRFPNDASQAHNDLGVQYSKMGLFDDAIPEYTAAVEQAPNNIRTLTNLATAYLLCDRLPEAEETFRMASDAWRRESGPIKPRDAAALLEGYAIAIIKLHGPGADGEFLALAEAALLQAIEAEPDNLQVRNNLGVLYTLAQRFDEAEIEFKKVLERERDNQFALDCLCQLSAARGSSHPPSDGEPQGEAVRPAGQHRDSVVGSSVRQECEPVAIVPTYKVGDWAESPGHSEFEVISERLSFSLERAGITLSDLESALPDARAAVVARLYPELEAVLKDGDSA